MPVGWQKPCADMKRSVEWLTIPHLSPEEQADIIQTCAAKLGRRPEHLEKDVWICWVLQNLYGMPHCLPMAFKEGLPFQGV